MNYKVPHIYQSSLNFLIIFFWLYIELSAYQILPELFLKFFFKLIQIIKNVKIFETYV